MPAYATRYGAAIWRVLQNYPPGTHQLVLALETVVKTAMEKTEEQSKDDIAQTSCLGLHPGAPAGLICRKCFDSVEQGQVPSSELQAGEPGPSKEEEEEIRRIDAEVAAMINTP